MKLETQSLKDYLQVFRDIEYLKNQMIMKPFCSAASG